MARGEFARLCTICGMVMDLVLTREKYEAHPCCLSDSESSETYRVDWSGWG